MSESDAMERELGTTPMLRPELEQIDGSSTAFAPWSHRDDTCD
jgi:hypothetical protein